MKQMPVIGDVMTPAPHTVGEDITLSKARERMHEFHIRHLPVQYGGRLVGVLSDRDIKLALMIHPAAKDLKVGDIMTEGVYAISSRTPLNEVAAHMAANKIGCAVVKDEREKAIGIFTLVDALTIFERVLLEHYGLRKEIGSVKS